MNIYYVVFSFVKDGCASVGSSLIKADIDHHDDMEKFIQESKKQICDFNNVDNVIITWFCKE